jgi:nucleoredoxin
MQRGRILFLILTAGLLAALGGCQLGPAPATSGSVSSMVDGKLINHAEEVIPAARLQDVKYTLLYFSAHWCPPCRKFTPELVKFYNKHKTDDNFEIVFVSADRNEAAMREYFAQMPWLAVRYADVRASGLAQRYAGPGIPCLVMVNADGEVVSDSYRNGQYVGPQQVLADLEGML